MPFSVARNAFRASFRTRQHARSVYPAIPGGVKCAPCVLLNAPECTERVPRHSRWREMRSVRSTGAASMHVAYIPPFLAAENALRACPCPNMRSVRSLLHARSAYPGAFRRFRNARSAIPASGMHAAYIPPSQVARNALCAFSLMHKHTHSAFPPDRAIRKPPRGMRAFCAGRCKLLQNRECFPANKTKAGPQFLKASRSCCLC